VEIQLIKRNGVPRAEVEAHQQIQREFDASQFSRRWRGYASFALARAGRGAGDDDIDLLLVTHTGMALIELKNWNGKLLESNGGKWYLDGEDRGDSPVDVVRRKVPKLVSVITQKLGKQKLPFISSYVVMHGRIGKMNLTPDEDKSVLTMTEFLTLRYDHSYRIYLGGRYFFNPLDHLKEYDEFFGGKSFRPKDYFIEGYKPDTNPIFQHPKKLYTEYRAEAKDDPKALALLRQWDFGALGLDLIGETDRAFIGLREQKVFQYIEDANQELSLSLLRPVSRKGPKDVTLDFAELFLLPSRLTRLAEFTHSTLPKLAADEKILLVKAIVSRFADLHDMRVAHRDVGEHSLWVDRPSRVVMSGFPAAYYPELKTVGTFRDKVKVEQSTLPEDLSSDTQATPYRRDVFMLAVLMHVILYGEKPTKTDEVYKWRPRDNDPYLGQFDLLLERSLSALASARYSNAREMLEALNSCTENTSQSILDLSAFEAYRADTKERDYDIDEVLSEGDEHSFFRCGTGDGGKIVKVWYGVEPDSKKPDLSLGLLSFLERARTLKGCGLSGIPRVHDFGLTRRSLLLVLSWADGQTLRDWLATDPSLESRLIVSCSLLDTLQRLHGFELSHGDIHPNNIVVNAKSEAVFIDILDFHLNSEDHYTTAYLPDNYKSITPFARDRFAIAAVLADVLGSNRINPLDGKFPISRIYEEIKNLLTSDSHSTLEPLERALQEQKQVKEEDAAEFTVSLRNLAYDGVTAGELRNDNGSFHISLQTDRQTAWGVRIWITGIGRQLSINWNLSEVRAEAARVSNIPQSQLLRSQTMRDDVVPMRIKIVEGSAVDVSDLIHFLLGREKIKYKLPVDPNHDSRSARKEENQRNAERPEPGHGEARDLLPVKQIWQALMDAEEEAFRTVTIAGEHRRNPYRDNQILIPYHLNGREIDYVRSDKVIVEGMTGDGQWRSCGELNLRDTTFGQLAELAVDSPFMKANLRIGSRLRLLSTGDKGSFDKRRFAVERVLADKAIIPNLVGYFEPLGESSTTTPIQHTAPSDAELEEYADGDKRLNPSQRDAFRKVLTNGPISLLQGPPGTGKTWFIAALLHYLMSKQRARRILLVSQAHEAVNNALEKGQELCRSKGIVFDAVRLGNESAVSDEIRHLHASSIEQSYRDKFKAEQKERIVQLAAALGLPHEFAVQMVDLHLRLGMLCERLLKLQSRLGEGNEAGEIKNARVRALTETFFDIALDMYGVGQELNPAETLSLIEARLVSEYEVRSVDGVEKLKKLLILSEDWLGALGSRDANFAEFLVKSRTVVAGTLVGIGARGTGVTQNVFDWVIIDEAGRAAPSELAVAMQAGHRVLLVGDHLQLPPTFSEEMREVVKQKFGCDDESRIFHSDFQRLFDSEYGMQVGATLLSQYRMAPDIGELVSSCFYKHRLETGRLGCPEYYDLLPAHFSKQVTWVDTSILGPKGYHQKSEDGADTSNRAEARVIMQVLKQIIEAEDFMAFLIEDLKPQEPPIGIICMYEKQRELIDQMKAEATWLGDARRLVKVDTVDSYQGKENRIVILSTVRNNPDGRPGFLTSPNRVNVALSRAMERLFIVGATKMWRGKNAELPLGVVLTKTEAMAQESRAQIVPATTFLEA
jgi:superfamily I DNA and/or RNA helicase/serine/threonine protein kinase